MTDQDLHLKAVAPHVAFCVDTPDILNHRNLNSEIEINTGCLVSARER